MNAGNHKYTTTTTTKNIVRINARKITLIAIKIVAKNGGKNTRIQDN